MPALPPVPQVLKIETIGNSGEATPLTWANVYHFGYSGTAPTNSTCDAIATQVFDMWATHMAPECVNNVSMNEVVVTDLTSPTSGVGTSFASSTGSRGDDEIPANVAFLVNYPVQRRYRGGHPRSYLIVGGNADFLDAAHWSSAFTAEVEAHHQAFLGGIVGFATGGCTISDLVNVSYYDKELNPVPPNRRTTPLVDPLVYTDAVYNEQMGSQRRRIGRHRR
jgi:hypothetical protein